MARKKKAELPKFIFTTQAVYVNNYVIQAKNQEEAEALFATVLESIEEGDPVQISVLGQLMQEEILQVKEAM